MGAKGLILVIASGGHPRPAACRAAVESEPVRPRTDGNRRQVRVAQVAVDKMKERRDLLNALGHIAGRRRTEIVVGVLGRRRGQVRRRGQRRSPLIAEACERESRTTARGGSKAATLRIGAL